MSTAPHAATPIAFVNAIVKSLYTPWTEPTGRMSARTLHRQLKEEGASLQTLKDEVRKTRAVDLLLRTQRPPKQVAQAAGFQNEKSFSRAFKGWTGQTPGEFQQTNRALRTSP